MELIRILKTETCRNLFYSTYELATMLGKNPYYTPYQYWRDMRAKCKFEIKDHNNYCENAICSWFSQKTGISLIEQSSDFVIKSNRADDNFGLFYAEPTKTYWIPDKTNNDQNKGVLHVFTTHGITNDQLLYYSLVAMLNSCLCGWTECYVAWLDGFFNFDYRRYEITDQVKKDMRLLTDQANAFIRENIIAGTEPPLRTLQDFNLKFPERNLNTPRYANEEIKAVLAEYIKTKREIADNEKYAEMQGLIIKMYMEECDKLVDKETGEVLATLDNAMGKRVVNFDSLRNRYPEVYDAVTTRSRSVRRLVIPELIKKELRSVMNV